MTNKNIAEYKHTPQASIFSYEMSKIKNKSLFLFVMTVMIQLSSFIFFSIVGKFDKSDDTISSFQGIIALSNTVSMCAFAIIGSVLLRKELVRFYIGEQRNRIFLFPVDRKELLVKKTVSFQVMLLVSFGAGLIVSLLVALMSNLFLNFDSSGLIDDLIIGLVSVLVSCLLVYIILLCSEIVAIQKQSEIATVVSAVVFMLLFSNLSAVGIMNAPFITLPIVILLSLLASAGFNAFATSIKKMEAY